MSKELCEIAIENDDDIPDELITKELCLVAIKQNLWNLSDVPEEFKTKEICDIAVNENKNNIRYVPDNLKSKKGNKPVESEDEMSDSESSGIESD
jgi:hypothetical protein